MVKIFFPSLLKKVTLESYTEVKAKTLGEVLDKLVEKYGDPFKRTIYESSGVLNRFLFFYIQGQPVIELNRREIFLNDDEEVAILVIVDGG